MGMAMGDKEGKAAPAPPMAVVRENNGGNRPPEVMRRSPSTIPPPPLPLVKGSLSIPIPKQDDDDCVTKRFYVNVFHPAEGVGGGTSTASDSVEAIRILPDDTSQVAFNAKEYDIDEDAVTKEIRFERTTGSSKKRNRNNSVAVRIRSIPSDTGSWKMGERDRLTLPGSSVRSALQAVFPKLLGYMQKAMGALTLPPVHRTPTPSLASARGSKVPISVPRPSRGNKTDKPRLRLSVNTYSRDLYQEIRSALNPAVSKALPAVDKKGFSITAAEPPKISVNALLLRRADKYSLLIRGRAVHPIAIRDIMVFADKKKVLYLSNALRDDAGYMEFSADVPLTGAVSNVLVVARHDDNVMGSQSLLIKKTG